MYYLNAPRRFTASDCHASVSFAKRKSPRDDDDDDDDGGAHARDFEGRAKSATKAESLARFTSPGVM